MTLLNANRSLTLNLLDLADKIILLNKNTIFFSTTGFSIKNIVH